MNMFQKWPGFELVQLGIRDLRAHQLRSFLTALGMIFGVGAVICMLSIGEGASATELESIRLLGSENIIIRSVQPPDSASAGERTQRVLEYGILRKDVERLADLPGVRQVVQMQEVANEMVYGARRATGAVVGTTVNFFEVVHVEIARGRALAPYDEKARNKVCVLGEEVARDLFGIDDPLGRNVTVLSRSTKPIPYLVVGILKRVLTAGSPAKGPGARDINRDVYLPLATATSRYGDLKSTRTSGSRETKRVEVSDVYLNAESEEDVLFLSRLVQRTMAFGHKKEDYHITVPLELLQQAERTKRTWQIVLGSIAGISLLVGGIGIMNIMLASVTERTREIGIRRALGAKKHHITMQFLVETLILSVSGGFIGVIAGISLAFLVTWVADFQTIIPWWGVVMSFMVSAIIGVAFGLYPARAAAALDPIQALRYD
ncbi:MAG: ABC transporter permease [Planctomycetes bacterium]|nr:ABC transporter permease [Planctomycetota bacterium]